MNWKKTSVILALLSVALPLWARLPECVEQACFTMVLEEPSMQSQWRVSSWEAWSNVEGMTLEMDATGGYKATLPGASDRYERFTTTLTLASPAMQTIEDQPLQTLTLTVTAAGFVERTEVTVELMKDAVLPPFEIQLIHGRMVMVAKDHTWYLVIDDPKARVHQDKKNPWQVTLAVANLAFDAKQKVQTATFYIGEGPVQAAAIAALPKVKE